MGRVVPLETRMWDRIPKGDPTACWIWTGNTGQKGGPVISIGKRSVSARRVLWELTRGVPPTKREQVATSCAVPECLNPDHLYIRPWQDDEARFWTFVTKAEGDACWEWTGTYFERGYGSFSQRINGVKKDRQAHRVAYELSRGIRLSGPSHGPTAQVVMHLCDNPKCVRPDHLELGTHLSNHQDMLRKGRAYWQKDPEGFRESIRQAHASRRASPSSSASSGEKP